jgi:O-antigen/teichoic acid export membrane protein
MSPAELGSLMLMLSLAGLLAVIFRLGIDAAVMRFHFDEPAEKLPTLYVTAAIIVGVGTLIVASVVTVVGFPTFPTLFVGLEFVPMGIIALLLATATAFQFVPTVWLRATEQPGRYLALTAGSFAVIGVGAFSLVVVADLGAVGALLGHLLGASVITLASAAVLFRGRPAFDATAADRLLRFGLPLLPHGLSQWVLNVSDRWLIGLLIGLPVLAARAEVGIYSFGYQIGYVIVIAAVSIQSAWTPQLYRLGETDRGPAVHRHMTTAAVALFAWMAATLALLSPYVIGLLAPASYADASSIMALVSLGATGYGTYVMIVGVIMLTRRTGTLPLITVGAAALNIALNIVLIPRIGIHGAAVATVASYWVYAAGAYILARTRYPIDLDWPRLVILAVIAVSGTAFGATFTSESFLPGLGIRALAVLAATAATLVVVLPVLPRLQSLLLSPEVELRDDTK